jgi:hypothetical protein
VKLASGTWQHLTGNQIGAIIAYFLIADPAGPRLGGPLITTVATSRVLRAIAELGSGVEVTDDLMIGFKFIGQLLDNLEEGSGGPAELVLASEESHGYLTTTDLRDKDAASGAYIIAHLHAVLRHSGRTLWDYLMDVFDAVGVHIEHGRSLVLLGADGAQKIGAVMASLRAEPLERLGSEMISVRRDFLVDGTDGRSLTASGLPVMCSSWPPSITGWWCGHRGPRPSSSTTSTTGSRRRKAATAAAARPRPGSPSWRRRSGPTAQPSTRTWPGGPDISCRRRHWNCPMSCRCRRRPAANPEGHGWTNGQERRRRAPIWWMSPH